MKKRLAILSILGLLVITGTVYGANKEGTLTPTSTQTSTSNPTLNQTQTQTTTSNPTSTLTQTSTATTFATKATKSNHKASIKLIDKVYETEKKNVMLSPTSLNYALKVLEEGTKGETKKELSTYIGTKDYKGLMKDYKGRDGIEIANAVWVDKGIKIEGSYKKEVEASYDAKVSNVDFKDSNTASIINNWCKEKTKGLIPKIVKEGNLSEDGTKGLIVNTVYFKSNWVDELEYNEREKKTFTTIDGKKRKISYLKGKGYQYYENKKAEAFSYPYRNGVEFIGILPKKKGEFKLSNLDIEGLIKGKAKEYDRINIEMPKIDYETDVELTDNLKELGIERIFSDQGDFSKLTKKKGLYVKRVIQKTKIKLDEKGTEASAVTAVDITDGISIPEGKPKVKNIKLNRGYAYVLYDRRNDEILFIGKVVDVK